MAIDPVTLALTGGAVLGGIFGGKRRKAPSYSPSPQYTNLQFGTVYPKLTEIIEQGGLKFDTAGMERQLTEDVAAQQGDVYNRIRAFSAPYGNPAAGNRLALRTAIEGARETSRGITGIRTQSELNRLNSLQNILGLASRVTDPNLAAFYANLGSFGAQQGADAQRASLFGDLSSLATLLWMNRGKTPAPATS